MVICFVCLVGWWVRSSVSYLVGFNIWAVSLFGWETDREYG